MYRWGTEVQKDEGKFAQGHKLGREKAGDLTTGLMEITWPGILTWGSWYGEREWKDLHQGIGLFLMSQYQNRSFYTLLGTFSNYPSG